MTTGADIASLIEAKDGWVPLAVVGSADADQPAKSVGFSGRANDNVEGDDSDQGRRLRHFHIAAEVISPLDR
jgi:hypothetical protein